MSWRVSNYGDGLVIVEHLVGRDVCCQGQLSEEVRCLNILVQATLPARRYQGVGAGNDMAPRT